MTTINKRVKIAADRRLKLDLLLPPNLPIGWADISVTITPMPDLPELPRPFEGLAGSLRGNDLFEGYSVYSPQKMCNEW